MSFSTIRVTVGRVILVAGVLVLLFIPYLLWGTGLITARAQDQLRQQFAAAQLHHHTDVGLHSRPPASTAPTIAPAIAAPAAGQPVGIISIPKIALQMVVVEGTDAEQLRSGPGHYPGTPLPGEQGNVAIAGHRTTYLHPFYNLNELVAGDDVNILTVQGLFVYQVTTSQAVAPTDVAVVAPTPDPDAHPDDLQPALQRQPAAGGPGEAGRRRAVRALHRPRPSRPRPGHTPAGPASTGRAGPGQLAVGASCGGWWWRRSPSPCGPWSCGGGEVAGSPSPSAGPSSGSSWSTCSSAHWRRCCLPASDRRSRSTARRRTSVVERSTVYRARRSRGENRVFDAVRCPDQAAERRRRVSTTPTTTAPAPTAASSPMSAPVKGSDDEPLTCAVVVTWSRSESVDGGGTSVPLTVGGVQPA